MNSKRNRKHSGKDTINQSPTNVLYVPHTILRDTSAYFLPYSQSCVETACYWFGIETNEHQVVTTLVLPHLFQTQGNYRVDNISSQRLANELSIQGLVNLAQVHTHPTGCQVTHSRYDDQHAYSTREGALSFVWPNYGHMAGLHLIGVGVHERREGRWVRLDEGQVTKRIRLVDSVADYRWQIDSGGIEENDDTK